MALRAVLIVCPGTEGPRASATHGGTERNTTNKKETHPGQ